MTDDEKEYERKCKEVEKRIEDGVFFCHSRLRYFVSVIRLGHKNG